MDRATSSQEEKSQLKALLQLEKPSGHIDSVLEVKSTVKVEIREKFKQRIKGILGRQKTSMTANIIKSVGTKKTEEFVHAHN